MGRLQRIYDAIGGRKMLALFLLVTVSIGCSFFLKEAEFATFMRNIAIMYGAFTIGNSAEHLSRK